MKNPSILICLAALVAGCESPEPAPAPPTFTQIVLDRTPPERPWYKMLGDIDGDGQLDVVVAGAKGPLVWYRYPSWEKSEIASGGWDGVNGEIGDIDGDGRADIVMGGLVWFRNPGPGGGEWVMTSIDERRLHDIELADLDSDGRLDVVARDQSAFGDPTSGGAIYIYRQTGPNAWTPTSFSCPQGEGLKLADLDRDGDPDIVIGDRWYENVGDPADWVEHVFAPGWTEPDAKVDVADLNGDGRLDVAVAPAELKGDVYKLSWFESPEEPASGEWREHIVVPEIETVVHAMALGDYDGDGAIDIAYAEMHQGEDPDEVVILLNRGAGDSWEKLSLSSDGSHDIVSGDISGDGDLDIVGANHAGEQQELVLWENNSR